MSQFGYERRIQGLMAQARRLYMHYDSIGQTQNTERAALAAQAARDFARVVEGLEDFHRDLTCGPDGKSGVDTLGNP